jgi:hypothetical protein
MPNLTIPGLPSTGTLSGAEVGVILQGTTLTKSVLSALVTHLLGQIVTAEDVQDVAGALISSLNTSGITVTYNDAAPSLTIKKTLKSNVGAGDPAVTDDNTQGYSQGSSWFSQASGLEWLCLDATTNAAKWVPLATARHPGLVSSMYYVQGAASTPTSGIGFTQDLLLAVPFRMPHRGTITDLVFRCSAAGTTNIANLKVGIYSNNNGRPGSLLSTGASIALSSVGDKTVSLTTPGAVTVEPGWYWIAYIFDRTSDANSGATTGLSNTAEGYAPWLIGASALSNVMNGSTAMTCAVEGSGATYAGGLPSSFGASTPSLTTNIMKVAAKVS